MHAALIFRDDFEESSSFFDDHVWLKDSPSNRETAKEMRKSGKYKSVTTFNLNEDESHIDSILHIAFSILLHHPEISSIKMEKEADPETVETVMHVLRKDWGTVEEKELIACCRS